MSEGSSSVTVMVPASCVVVSACCSGAFCCWNRWVLNGRFNEEGDSSGDRRAVGSRFQVLRPYAAKLRWPVDVRVQGTRRAPETA